MTFTHHLGTLLVAGALLTPAVHAQTEVPSPAKQLQQSSIEAMAQQLLQAPIQQLSPQLNAVISQRVPADKREAVAAEIQADVKKYFDETAPLLRERAVKLAPTTIGNVLEDKLTEAELKQVVAMLESPAIRKFQGLLGDMQRSLSEKLVAETRAQVQAKIQALQASISSRLAPYAGAAAAASAPGSK
jgi:uncharacterized protein